LLSSIIFVIAIAIIIIIIICVSTYLLPPSMVCVNFLASNHINQKTLFCIWGNHMADYVHSIDEVIMTVMDG